MLQGPWGPGCHPDKLIDIANTSLASRSSLETICMICEGYRTHHRGVTGPISFKKIRTFFFGDLCSRDFGATDCYPSTLIDLANTVLASRSTVETICMISGGYRTHRGVTGPMNFKSRTSFLWKIGLPGLWGTWLPSKHFN